MHRFEGLYKIIELCVWYRRKVSEGSKTELGMAHYEVRQYSGWHPHILTYMGVILGLDRSVF